MRDLTTSVLQRLGDQRVTGATTALETLVAAIAIADGLAFSSLLVPQRLTEIMPGRANGSVGRSL